MKFKKGTRRKATEYEKDLIQYWKENKTFEKSIEMRPKSNAYVFYDGLRLLPVCHITVRS